MKSQKSNMLLYSASMVVVIVLAIALTNLNSHVSPGKTKAGFSSADAQTTWAGDFETGNFSQWQWNKALEAVPGRMTIYSKSSQPSWPAPRQGNYAARISVDNSDFKGESTGARAQVDGPQLWKDGDETYWGWSTFFPTDFPYVPDGSWFSFGEIYGDIDNGSPILGFQVHGNSVLWTRDQDHNYDVPWTAALQKGSWNDFELHIKFSHNPAIGYVELWYNGVQQKFSNGSTRLYGNTMRPSDNNEYPITQSYRQFDAIPGTVTLYQDAMRAGPTFASANPASSQLTTLAGDINGDGHVNTLDLSVLLNHDNQNYAPADFNKDNTVGAADLAILLSHWTW